MNKTYYERNEEMLMNRLNKLVSIMPNCFGDYILNGNDLKTSTKLAYARDLYLFYLFLSERNSVDELNIDDNYWKEISSEIIDEFRSYLKNERDSGKIGVNAEKSIDRKITAISNMYFYLYTKGEIESYPACLNDRKCKNTNDRKCKNTNEVVAMYAADMLIKNVVSDVCTSNKLVGRQVEYAKITRYRDMSIIRLLCDTGMTLSQCVALNCEDVDLINKTVVINTPEGRTLTNICDETVMTIEKYMIKRRGDENKSEDGDALFLSIQHRRMTGRSIEMMLKRYSFDWLKPSDLRKARYIIKSSLSL